jgi:hypothetical protein
MFEKIWTRHVVAEGPGSQTLLYIDRHLLHEGGTAALTRPRRSLAFRASAGGAGRDDRSLRAHGRSSGGRPVEQLPRVRPIQIGPDRQWPSRRCRIVRDYCCRDSPFAARILRLRVSGEDP